MAVVSASVVVPGRIAQAEELFYDPARWPVWVDDFGHIVQVGEQWPREVEDERMRGTQTVSFEADGDSCKVTLTLDFTLKRADPLRPLVALFSRRPLRDSLQRTLTRFRREREAVGWLP